MIEIIAKLGLAVGLSLVTWTFFLMTANINFDSVRRFVTLLTGWVMIVFSAPVVVYP